jgi:hypothetical protein
VLLESEPEPAARFCSQRSHQPRSFSSISTCFQVLIPARPLSQTGNACFETQARKLPHQQGTVRRALMQGLLGTPISMHHRALMQGPQELLATGPLCRAFWKRQAVCIRGPLRRDLRKSWPQGPYAGPSGNAKLCASEGPYAGPSGNTRALTQGPDDQRALINRAPRQSALDILGRAATCFTRQ